MTDLPEVDPVFVEHEAQRRELAWARSAGLRASERAADRQRLPLGERIERVVGALSTVSTVPAARLQQRVTSSAYESAPPPLADQPEIRSRLTLVERHVEALESLLDAYQGRCAPAELARLPTEAKNAYILAAMAGVPSAYVSADFPELGSARTIERVRREAGLRPSTGLDV
jgi:hypothetical protein